MVPVRVAVVKEMFLRGFGYIFRPPVHRRLCRISSESASQLELRGERLESVLLFDLQSLANSCGFHRIQHGLP